MDCDFVHFFEDGTKLKTPSDFYPPLTASVMHHNTQSYKTLRNDLYGIDIVYRLIEFQALSLRGKY